MICSNLERTPLVSLHLFGSKSLTFFSNSKNFEPAFFLFGQGLGEASPKKNEKIWDNVPKSEMSQFQFGNFENRGGGGLYFSKMSQFQLFDSVFCNITFIRNV